MTIIDWKYLSLPRENRRSHLDLLDACIERGGNSTIHKGVLAQFLNTNIPSKLPEGRVCLCHACHNGRCSNPKHIYWGTDKDNYIDQLENKTHKKPSIRMIEKYGKEKTLRLLSEYGTSNIKEYNKNVDRRKKSCYPTHRGFNKEEVDYRLQLISDIDMTEFGWVSKVAKRLQLSHTQVRRFINKYYKGKTYSRN